MRKRVPRRSKRPSAAQQRQRQVRQAQRQQMAELGREAKSYSAHAIATLMFFGSGLMMIAMGLPLLYAVGGPLFVTPFAYFVLKTGRDPQSIMSEAMQPPGDESAFRRR